MREMAVWMVAPVARKASAPAELVLAVHRYRISAAAFALEERRSSLARE
jgi:hypothetical protein